MNWTPDSPDFHNLVYRVPTDPWPWLVWLLTNHPAAALVGVVVICGLSLGISRYFFWNR